MQDPEELQKAFGFLYAAELLELRRLALALPPSPKVVNIGAGVGTSAATFLQARRDLVLTTVDLQAGVSPHGGLGNERGALKDMGLLVNRYGYFQIAGDSKQVGKEWRAHWKINMVFIDGDHSYEGCAGDIRAWFPHLLPGGYMAIHDYGKNAHYLKMKGLPDNTQMTPEMLAEAKAYPGVDTAVIELLLSPGKLDTFGAKVEFISHIDSLITFKKLQE